MYESPINLVTKQLQTEISKATDEYALKAVQECGVVVDKEELIKALNYDRQQYAKGYADAKQDVILLIQHTTWLTKATRAQLIAGITQLPSADPGCDEWCTDCKEYDAERHCCPRWNRVIRETLADMRERGTGKWIYCEDMCGVDGYRCDKCGFHIPWDYTHKFIDFINDYHYCPNCGARMEGGEK